MSQTILITGASSGIGKATAQYFYDKGWNVVASMRSPDKATDWQSLERMAVVPLDVTDNDSIKAAIATALDRFGQLDAVLNNAGYGLSGPLEGMSSAQINRQFQTNVTGLMEVTKAMLPHFRERKNGLIINISSIGGRVTFPFLSAYHGTKWAVEGISESLRYELKPFNIRVKVIEPGPINTSFNGRSMDFATHNAYSMQMEAVEASFSKMIATMPGPDAVAKVIYRAATDNSRRFRYPAKGSFYLIMRRISPLWLWESIIKRVFSV